MIGAELAVPLGALCAALAFAVGCWLGERRADDERRLREAAVDHLNAYTAQVIADQQTIKALRAQLDELHTQAQARARSCWCSACRAVTSSAVHGPKGGQCEELDEKKTVLQDGSADV